MTSMLQRAEAVIDLAAIRRNLDVVQARAGDAPVMPVVKANGYGHGMLPIAGVARDWGATWLGVALPSEAIELRAAGDTGRVLAWLWAPGDPDVADCVAADVDLSVSSLWALVEVVSAARLLRRRARVHVKVDTGLSRNGVTLEDLPQLLDALATAQSEGVVEAVALWTHLADADLPGSPAVPGQMAAFAGAESMARSAGVDAPIRHLSNSGGLWAAPQLRRDLVRVGIAMYGLTPSAALGTAADLGLTPAMTVRARLAGVKSVPAGTSVSYGSTWTAPERTTLGLVPLGYADGMPRAAGGVVEVAVGGRRVPTVGRMAMDQFVIDLGPEPGGVSAGDLVHVFGPGDHGEPTADDWAMWSGTIGYEVVTRIGPRVPRTYQAGPS